MKILICNVGSTSLKYRLLDMGDGERSLAWGKAERVGSEESTFAHDDLQGGHVRLTASFPTHREAIQEMLRCLEGVTPQEEIACVGFKVVHAKGVTGVQLLEEPVLQAMEAYNSVAPAHNPPYLAAIRLFAQLMPHTPLIGSFETGFHATMPPEAYLYSLPAELCREEGIRRYGFHGASHEYVSQWVAAAMGRTDLRLVSCHLGGSGSLCAVKDGRSIDTSLGFSLQCGVMHNNRIGDIDPFITFYLMEAKGMSPQEIKELYSKKSGFYGMSGGISNDLRDIEAAAAQGNQDAQNAVNSYAYQIKKYIGSYAAAMGGLDAIAFAGGIGENSAQVRQKALAGLEFLGVRLDPEKNAAPQPGDDLSQEGAPVRIYVVATNEELIVARKAAAWLEAHPDVRAGGR